MSAIAWVTAFCASLTGNVNSTLIVYSEGKRLTPLFPSILFKSLNDTVILIFEGGLNFRVNIILNFWSDTN